MQILGNLLPNVISDDDARKLLEEELSRSIYSDSKSLYEIIRDFLNSLFNFRSGNSTSYTQTFIDWLIIIVLILIVSGIGYVLYKRKKTSQSKLLKTTSILDDRSYQQLILSAKNAVKNNNDYTIGVLETYRAIIKYLHISQIIIITKNMTPNEASVEIYKEKPEYKEKILKATQIFNRVMYGDRTSSKEEYLFLKQFLEEIVDKDPLYKKSYEGFGYGGIH